MCRLLQSVYADGSVSVMDSWIGSGRANTEGYKDLAFVLRKTFRASVVGFKPFSFFSFHRLSLSSRVIIEKFSMNLLYKLSAPEDYSICVLSIKEKAVLIA